MSENKNIGSGDFTIEAGINNSDGIVYHWQVYNEGEFDRLAGTEEAKADQAELQKHISSTTKTNKPKSL